MVNVSAATLSRTFAHAALTKKRAQPRHYYKYTPENIEYYRPYVHTSITSSLRTSRRGARCATWTSHLSSHTRGGLTSTGARRASRFTPRTTVRVA
jgi:hypothetical protein